MISTDRKNYPGYVQEAIISFNAIMSNNHKKTMDHFNRTNKGELFVLHFLLMRDNNEVLPSELSAALQSSPARISALLGALEKKGLVEREIDKSDRRNILVTITAAGRKRIKKKLEEMQGFLARIFTDMGAADTNEFIRLAGRFSELSQKHMPDLQDRAGGFQSG